MYRRPTPYGRVIGPTLPLSLRISIHVYGIILDVTLYRQAHSLLVKEYFLADVAISCQGARRDGFPNREDIEGYLEQLITFIQALAPILILILILIMTAVKALVYTRVISGRSSCNIVYFQALGPE